MWNKVIDDKTRTALLEEAGFFHDTCLTELRYISGAYVGKDLAMYPINDKRKVNVFIQRQEEGKNIIELEFSGIEYLKLFPYDEKYTCEIFGISTPDIPITINENTNARIKLKNGPPKITAILAQTDLLLNAFSPGRSSSSPIIHAPPKGNSFIE